MVFKDMRDHNRQVSRRAPSNRNTAISAGAADPLGLDLSGLQRLVLIVTLSAMLWLALIGAASAFA